MKITIIHDVWSIDPHATYAPEEFPAVRESLEREYTKELLKAFPHAQVYFESGSGLSAYCLRVEGGEEERSTVQAILEDVWSTGNFWL